MSCFVSSAFAADDPYCLDLVKRVQAGLSVKIDLHGVNVTNASDTVDKEVAFNLIASTLYKPSCTYKAGVELHEYAVRMGLDFVLSGSGFSVPAFYRGVYDNSRITVGGKYTKPNLDVVESIDSDGDGGLRSLERTS